MKRGGVRAAQLQHRGRFIFGVEGRRIRATQLQHGSVLRGRVGVEGGGVGTTQLQHRGVLGGVIGVKRGGIRAAQLQHGSGVLGGRGWFGRLRGLRCAWATKRERGQDHRRSALAARLIAFFDCVRWSGRLLRAGFVVSLCGALRRGVCLGGGRSARLWLGVGWEVWEVWEIKVVWQIPAHVEVRLEYGAGGVARLEQIGLFVPLLSCALKRQVGLSGDGGPGVALGLRRGSRSVVRRGGAVVAGGRVEVIRADAGDEHRRRAGLKVARRRRRRLVGAGGCGVEIGGGVGLGVRSVEIGGGAGLDVGSVEVT